VIALSTCQSSTAGPSPSSSLSPRATATPLQLPACAAGPAPAGAEAILTGLPAPDDLAIDAQGRLLFSDLKTGAVSRLEASGLVAKVADGIHNPEGIVVRQDGTLLVTEQLRNRVDVVDPQTHAVVPWHVFPNPAGRDGIDGLGRDRSSHDVIVPDSPNGVVWRLTNDGTNAVLIGRGMVRPVGADVDVQGNVYVADEGGPIWRIGGTPLAQVRVVSLRIPDDVVIDRGGSVVVNTLGDGMVHLVAPDGSLTTLLAGLRNPQGIVLDGAGNLYVTEFDAGRIDRLVRAFVLGRPAVTRPDATHVIVCLPVRRASGYTLPLAVGLDDTHNGLQSVVASRQAIGDLGGAIEVAVDPADHSGVIDLRVGDGDRSLIEQITLSPTG
jgi:sugar lactone lactonase YvrE